MDDMNAELKAKLEQKTTAFNALCQAYNDLDKKLTEARAQRDEAKSEVARLQRLKPSDPHVFPTLVLTDQKPKGPHCLAGAYLRLPDERMVPLLAGSEVEIRTETDHVTSATVTVVLGGIETKR